MRDEDGLTRQSWRTEIAESMLFVLGYTLTCIDIGLALGLAIGKMNNTKK